MNIIQALRSPRAFKPFFEDLRTWGAWDTYLRALFALEKPAQAQFRLFQESTQLRKWPIKVSRESFVVCGRRGGKTTAVSLISSHLALFKDWGGVLSKGERGYIFIIAVNKSQGAIIKEKIEAILELQPHFKSMVSKITVDEIELKNGITIAIKPASFRSVRGYTILCAILEELSFWRYEEAAVPDVEIIRAIRPGLLRDGLLIGISSPWAMSGFLYKQYKRYYGKRRGPLIWHAPTQRMNPTYSKEKIRQAYAEDPVSAATEFGAEFRKDTSTYCDPDVIDACIMKRRYGLPFRSGLAYHAFIDPSGARSDSFTLGIAHREKDRAVLDHVAEYAPPFRPENVIDEYSKIIQSYRLRTATSDRYAGDLITSPFRNYGIEIIPSTRTKSEIFGELLPLLLNGKCELLDNSRLISQLKSLDRKTRQGGKDMISNYHGHDDVINAAAGSIISAFLSEEEKPFPISVFEAANRPERDARFDMLSERDQQQVEEMREHSWLLEPDNAWEREQKRKGREEDKRLLSSDDDF